MDKTQHGHFQLFLPNRDQACSRWTQIRIQATCLARNCLNTRLVTEGKTRLKISLKQCKFYSINPINTIIGTYYCRARVMTIFLRRNTSSVFNRGPFNLHTPARRTLDDSLLPLHSRPAPASQLQGRERHFTITCLTVRPTPQVGAEGGHAGLQKQLYQFHFHCFVLQTWKASKSRLLTALLTPLRRLAGDATKLGSAGRFLAGLVEALRSPNRSPTLAAAVAMAILWSASQNLDECPPPMSTNAQYKYASIYINRKYHKTWIVDRP